MNALLLDEFDNKRILVSLSSKMLDRSEDHEYEPYNIHYWKQDESNQDNQRDECYDCVDNKTQIKVDYIITDSLCLRRELLVDEHICNNSEHTESSS